MMNRIEEAILYATGMHQGKVRKLVNTPLFLHPLEVAQILSAMTSDEDVITAGMMAELARTIHAVTVSEADGFPYATERLKPYIEGGIGRVDGVLAGRCMALVNEISASGTLLHGKCVPAEG